MPREPEKKSQKLSRFPSPVTKPFFPFPQFSLFVHFFLLHALTMLSNDNDIAGQIEDIHVPHTHTFGDVYSVPSQEFQGLPLFNISVL